MSFDEYSSDNYDSEDYGINTSDNVGGFQVGDKVKVIKSSWYYEDHKEEILTVYCFRKAKNRIGLLFPNPINEHGEGDIYLEPSDLEYYGVPDNVLSRVLYPNWVENNGLLVPRIKEDK